MRKVSKTTMIKLIEKAKQNKKTMENESQPPARQNVMPRPIIIKKTQ